MRLNPRDERSRLALAQTLAAVGRSAEAEDVLRTAVAELPDASALRWRLSTRSQAEQDDDDRALIDMADRLVLLVGKGELYRALAGLAQLHLDDDKAIGLLQRAVGITPNNAAAHKALGRAYVENGRDAEGYAELVIALLLDPDDVETLTALGRWHLTADQPARAVEALERAVGIDPTNRLAVHALAGALIRVGRVSEGKQRLQESERLQAQAIEDDRRAKAAAVLRLNAEMRMAGTRLCRCSRYLAAGDRAAAGKCGHPSPTRGGARRGEPPRRGSGGVPHGDFTERRHRRSSPARGAVRRAGTRRRG